MKLLTGNDLASGDVIWWTGTGWSRHVADAVDAGEEGAEILAREEAARRVNASYIIDATMTDTGPLPAHPAPPTGGSERGEMMPTRRRTRAAERLRRIAHERAFNDAHVAERNLPPPF